MDAIEAGRVERALRSRQCLTILVLLGLALRVWAYAASTSLWLDEILLARNILGLSVPHLLTEPLGLDQVAPRGFLLVEKLAVLAFGDHELALRLIPFLCGVAGLFLFRRLAERTLDGLAVPFAVAIFAVGVPLIRFGAEVKQYELDATATIALMLIALRLREPGTSPRTLVAAGLAGLAVVWFSQASVVVMAGIGIALAAHWLASRDAATRDALLVTIPMWAVAAVVAIFAGTRSMTPSTRQFMNEFWAPGFVPALRSPGDLLWFWTQFVSIFGDPTLLRYPWPATFFGIALLGTIALWRRRRDLALLLLGPVAVGVAAAAARLYPFRGRLMFYLIPVFLLFLAAGAGWIRRLADRLHPTAGTAILLALLIAPAAAILKAPPPYDIEHGRSLLAYLQQHRQPGDAVYVFSLHRIATLYYGPLYGLQPAEWTTGICDPADTRAYVRAVDRYRGARRVWVFSAGVGPFRPARAATQNYLATIGVKLQSLSLPSLQWESSAMELYDLSDPVRLRAASADTFAVRPMPTDPRPGCRPWMAPSPLDAFP